MSRLLHSLRILVAFVVAVLWVAQAWIFYLPTIIVGFLAGPALLGWQDGRKAYNKFFGLLDNELNRTWHR